jgi:hypothetical protein
LCDCLVAFLEENEEKELESESERKVGSLRKVEGRKFRIFYCKNVVEKCGSSI